MLADVLYSGAVIVPVGRVLDNLGAVFCHRLRVTSQRVPLVAAELPWQLRLETSKGVEQCPGDDHVVIDGNEECDEEHAIAEAFEEGS